METKLDKKYNPKDREIFWKNYWEDKKIYQFNKENNDKIFSIDTPPPTVSGKMHMGHAFMFTQMDFIARFKRMQGYNVFYPFGTDDNGLPTKLLIEKQKKVRANSMSRKEFTKLCLDTLEKELRPKYIEDWKRIGTSCDYSLYYSTIDEHSQKISQKSFLDLYKKNREYLAEAPAMYCPKCQTAISQVECEDKDIDSHFNDIVFKVENQDLIIATTRPELLPACVAIFYHPSDERYKSLKNKKAKVPLFNFEVEILEDERVDPEKGTGIVMCCTFGDTTDMEWQKAYNLPIKEAINKSGRMTKLAGKYENLKIEEARKEIIKDLKENQLLINQKPIKHSVNVHERCGTPIEYMHSKQWFIKYLDLKEDMIKWGNELKWFPEHMKNRYDNWVKGLQWDWCISRQIPFGVPFPVWYCKECGEVILAEENQLPIDPMEDKPPITHCPKCNSTEFIPEKDIINTWATSSLTPILTKELTKGTKSYETLSNSPMDIRPQGHDIITFWLFNTVVKHQLHKNFNPWKNCFITGWALDPKGKKMSKSRGNIIEPQTMIEKYSADALRYWAANTKLGEDVAFQEKDLVTAKKTITKLFNAAKYVSMNINNDKKLTKEDIENYNFEELETMDKWIISKIQKIIKTSTKNFEKYEFSKVKSNIDYYFWHDLCDNYFEVIKDRLYNPEKYSEKEHLSAKITLYKTLLNTIKIMAPFLSFITEEVYQAIFKEYEEKDSIHITNWPKYNEKEYNPESIETGDLTIEIISKVRKLKTEKQLSLKTEIKKLTIITTTNNINKIKRTLKDIKTTTKSQEITFEETSEDKIETKIEI